jgi:hypothetical protein
MCQWRSARSIELQASNGWSSPSDSLPSIASQDGQTRSRRVPGIPRSGEREREREREREETHRPLRSTYSTSHVADCVHTSRVLHARLHCKSLRPTPARLRSERCTGGRWSARGRSYSDGERPNTTRASVRSDEMERGRSYIQYMGSTCGDRPRTRGRPCSRVLRVIV